ncbi:MAG: hypothetical protein ACLFRR_09895 [Spirochaetaceae bacterium]
METAKISMQDELVSSLRSLVSDTEEIFLGLAEHFPKLLSEMDAGLSSSRDVLESLRGDQERHESGRLERTIEEARGAVSEATGTFARMHEQDESLFSELDAAIQTLGRLESLITEIREDSVEMELVSINAMTVALKTGSAGRAFSYITEELKRLSTRTIDLTETITARGNTLLEDFRVFRRDVATVKEQQDELFNRFSERLTGSFDSFLNGVQHAGYTLSSIHEKAAGIREPLSRIMEEVQIHDIVKQSVDHVIISLEELQEVSDAEDEEHVLDELSFLAHLPQLCITLLDDIRERLESSLGLFREKATEARGIIDEAERDRRAFVERSMHAGTEEREGLQTLFYRASQMLDELLDDVHRSVDMKRRLIHESEQLLADVDRIESDFRAFSSITTRFRSIDIASRIEVAKQDVLQEMVGTVGTMNELTHKIEHDVEVSLDATHNFTGETSDVISRYQQVFADEERLVTEFDTRMRRLSGELEATKDDLAARIEGFSLFSERFVGLFREMNEQLDGLQRLLSSIDTVNDQLRRLQQTAEKRMQPLLEARGISEWRIRSDRLKSMIERFTIFTHKKTVGDLAGFDVEQGAPSGDITMF